MLLGLDWGQQKIGIAIAEEEICIATALDILENDSNVFDGLFAVVKTYDITKVVIGRSSHMSQDDNVKKIDKFANKCRERCDVEVVFEEEMFSTREAHVNLKNAGKKKIDSIDDSESARIILQQYLDSNY